MSLLFFSFFHLEGFGTRDPPPLDNLDMIPEEKEKEEKKKEEEEKKNKFSLSPRARRARN